MARLIYKGIETRNSLLNIKKYESFIKELNNLLLLNENEF